MKKLILILAIGFSTLGYSQAKDQDYKTKAKDKVETLKKTVTLSAEDEKKLLDIYFLIEKTNADKNLSQEVKKAKVEELKIQKDKIISLQSK